MASTTGVRRSSRRISKVPKIQDQEEIDADDGIDLESSGSDFEQDMIKEQQRRQGGMNKLRRKHESVVSMVSEESTSSSGDDEDDPEFKSDRIKKRNKLSLSTVIDKQKRVSNGIKKAAAAPAAPKIKSTLSLSESSSDDENEGREKEKTKVKECHRPRIKVTNGSPVKQSQDCSVAASQLAALASAVGHGGQEIDGGGGQSDHAWVRISPRESMDHYETEVKCEEEDGFAQDVAAALAMGEGHSEPFKLEAKDEGSDGENEDEEKREEDDHNGDIKGVEVTVALPEKHKRKKKEFDVEAHIRREINRTIRETQLAMHHSHVVLLLAHLRHTNNAASSSLLKAVALSVVPKAHLAKAPTLTGLTQLLSWFKSAFVIVESPSRRDLFPPPLVAHLARRFEARTPQSAEDLVLMFLLVVRAMGWRARLVHNFATVALKPDSKDLEVVVKKDTVVKDDSGESSSTSSKLFQKDKEEVDKKASSKGKGKGKKSAAPKTPATRDKSPDLRKGKNKGESSRSSRKSSRFKEEDKKEKKSSLPADEKKDSARKRKSSSPCPSPKKRSKRPSLPDKSKETGTELKDKESARPESRSRRSTRSTRSSSTIKNKSVSPNKKEDEKKVKLNAEALIEIERRKSSRHRSERSSSKKDYCSPSEDEDDDEGNDGDFEPPQPKKTSRRRSSAAAIGAESKKKAAASPPTRSSSSAKRSTKGSSTKKLDYWIEVCVKGDWVTVDAVRGMSGQSASQEMERRASTPMLYVVACNEDGTVKDVTPRYVGAGKYMTHTRKKRTAQDWFQETLAPFRPTNLKSEAAEDKKLQKLMESVPLPTAIGAFKDHPLYVLTRHLLKFEALYPPEPPTVGFIRGEAIYPRECVHTLHCRVTWHKQGRVVKVGEKPYKVVTARPKWDRVNATVIKDQPLDIFGHWQTELYVPPPAENGKVPRNEYGNVEFFQPWMLPKGTVHIPVAGINRVAKKLGIDCAPAMTGWEFHKCGVHPVFDGFVICEEFKDTLMDAWNTEMEEKAKRDERKREKRVLDNWKKLIKGLLIAKRIKAKYLKEDD